MTASQDRVLFIGDCSFWSEQAGEFISYMFKSITHVFWENGMPPNPEIESWRGDWIISFKSDMILSESIISRACKGAINFHPSSTKYRGIGGYHYAIDNEDQHFGATCHHMDKKIDHGQIIKTVEFRIAPLENPELLRQRTAANCLVLLYDICIKILNQEELPAATQKWSAKLHTKKSLESYLKFKENQVYINLQ